MKIALPIVAFALVAGNALAADLPSHRAEPALPPPPPPTWAGFYVGLNAGGTWANSNQQNMTVAPVAQGFLANTDVAAFLVAGSASGFNSGSNGGFIGGGQLGYNWQVTLMGANLVIGAEADIQGVAGNSGNRNFVVAAPTTYGNNWVGLHSARGSVDYLGTVRGRVGWLVNPTLMFFGTGGLAYGGVGLNTSSFVYDSGWSARPTSTGGVNFSDTQVGWTGGGGVEWMFMPNWSAKAEYLYYDLGSVTQGYAMPVVDNAGNTALFGGQARARISGNIVRAGMNYHFNWGGSAPVVAKY